MPRLLKPTSPAATDVSPDFLKRIRKFLSLKDAASDGPSEEMRSLYWRLATSLDELYALKIAHRELYEEYKKLASQLFSIETFDEGRGETKIY